jgi:hypothetical protein
MVLTKTLTIREGIAEFLGNRTEHSPYLIPLWSPEMETQVQVYPGDSDDDDSEVWTDGETTWFNHRWPRNAWAEPYYKDKPLTFSPGIHVQYVGSTGWNFVKRLSFWLAFDVDSKDGHKGSVGVDDNTLEEFVEAAGRLPYTTILRSKSGRGYHCYLFFDESDRPATNNHSEHAALATFALAKMSSDAGYDFSKVVDVKGGNFWIWAAERSPHAFELVQEAFSRLRASDLDGWRDLLTPQSVNVTPEDYQATELSDEHKTILKALEQQGYAFRWLPDKNMAHTHTAAIGRLYETGTVKGVFATNSKGNDPTKPNCFLTLRPNGAFRAGRFQGAAEHPLWESSDGKTWCYINQPMPPLVLLRKFGGSELVFQPADLETVLNLLGETLGPNHTEIKQPIQVRSRRNTGEFVASFAAKHEPIMQTVNTETGQREDLMPRFEGWEPVKNGWQKTLPIKHDAESFTAYMMDGVDDLVRFILLPDNKPAGWATNSNNPDAGRKEWVFHGRAESIATTILNDRYGPLATEIKASIVKNPWREVFRPFESEYVGIRQWNKDAPRFKCGIAQYEAPTPFWDKIWNHLGRGLNIAIENDPVCRDLGIQSGAQYLQLWVKIVAEMPAQLLPYLFFFSPQNCGKSTGGIALGHMFEGVDQITMESLTGTFSGELGDKVICILDEMNLHGTKAYNTLKRYMSPGSPLRLRPMYAPPYTVKNHLHFWHFANAANHLPFEDEDTRINVIEVYPIDDKDMVDFPILDAGLKQEAPFMLRRLLEMERPKQHGRFWLPLINTAAKELVIADKYVGDTDHQRAAFVKFAADRLERGGCIKFCDLYNAYLASVERITTSDGRSLKPYAPNTILKHLNDVGFDVTSKEVDTKDFRGKVYVGVQLRAASEESA